MPSARPSCRPTIPLILAAATLLLAGSSAAQDFSEMSLEELLNVKVVTASKSLERMRDAPGVVTVVTAKEIEELGAVNLVDVLNRLPSVQVLSSHLWVQAKPVIRGNLITHADHHTLILINGRPFRDALESNSNLALYQAFPINLIDRIELVRGPGSVLYGSNAVAGVINIITKRPDVRRATDVSVGAGSFGAELASFNSYWSGDDWSLAVGATHFQEDGWDFSATTNHPDPALGIRSGHTNYGENNQSAAAFFDYKGRFSTQLVYNDIGYDDLGILPHWLFQGTVSGARYFLDLGYTQPLGHQWELHTNVTVNDWKKYITDESPSGSNTDKVRATVIEVSATGSLGNKTKMIVGALNERKENRDVTEFIPFVQSAAVPFLFTENHKSAYVQLENQTTTSLKLVGGAQFHRTASGHSDLLPRLGINYNLNSAMAVKLLYGEAFRTATPLEEYIDIPGVLIGNRRLAPEKGRTYDAQFFLATTHGVYTFTVFNTSFTDIVERYDIPDGSGTQGFANTGRVDTRGLEIEGKHYLNEWMYVSGSLVFQDERDNHLYIPDNMEKISFAYNKDRIALGLSYSRFGKPRSPENTLGGLQLNEPVSPIDLLTASFTYRFPRSSHLELNVYGLNLLNDPMSYSEFSKGWVSSLPIGSSRAFYGSLRVRF